jgi:hypothetical protein
MTDVTVTYTCHSVLVSAVDKVGTFEGQEVIASVPSVEVELIADDKANGSVKLRFWGDKVAGAQEFFKTDQPYTCAWSAATPTAAAPSA